MYVKLRARPTLALERNEPNYSDLSECFAASIYLLDDLTDILLFIFSKPFYYSNPSSNVELVKSKTIEMQTKSDLSLLRFAIIALAWLAGFLSRLFAVIRFESIIHEFDPWFNYRATHYMTEHGWYDFLNWFDERAWYPLGRIVGGTTFPGLMIVSGSIHYVLQLLNISVHIRDICVFLAPIFSGLTAIATYLLTKELWNEAAGLFAACFVAIGK